MKTTTNTVKLFHKQLVRTFNSLLFRENLQKIFTSNTELYFSYWIKAIALGCCVENNCCCYCTTLLCSFFNLLFCLPCSLFIYSYLPIHSHVYHFMKKTHKSTHEKRFRSELIMKFWKMLYMFGSFHMWFILSDIIQWAIFVISVEKTTSTLIRNFVFIFTVVAAL